MNLTKAEQAIIEILKEIRNDYKSGKITELDLIQSGVTDGVYESIDNYIKNGG